MKTYSSKRMEHQESLSGEDPLQPTGNDSVGDDNLAEDEFELLVDDDMLEVYEDDNGEMEQDAEGVGETSDEDEVQPEFDHSSFTFRSHLGPVYCCVFHPNGRFAASGCENEMLYVWDSINKEILLEEKFEDSVTLIQFNHDGKYLAAADMLGNFCCWKCTNEFKKIYSLKLNSPSWMEWHPVANVLVLAEKLHFYMWKVPSFEIVKYFVLDSYSEAGCLMPDGKNAVIGYDEGNAIILDLSTFTVASKLKHHGMNYDHGIVSVDVHPDNNLVALGTKKGRVMLFTTKKSKVVGILDMPAQESESYIESVKFGRNSLSGMLLVAFSNYLHIYDYSKLALRHQIILSGHAVRLVCAEPLAYIATSKAIVEVCDCRNGSKKSPLQGHTKPIMDLTLSKDRKKLMTSSDDTTVKIFDIDSNFLEERPQTSGQ